MGHFLVLTSHMAGNVIRAEGNKRFLQKPPSAFIRSIAFVTLLTFRLCYSWTLDGSISDPTLVPWS